MYMNRTDAETAAPAAILAPEDPLAWHPGAVLLRCMVQDPMARRVYFSAVFPYQLPPLAQWRIDRAHFIGRFQAYLAPRWDLSSLLFASVCRVDGPLPAEMRAPGDGSGMGGGGLDYQPMHTCWRP